MAFKTFTNAVLTAADLNDNLMEQAVIVCTSATRPTAQEGMTLYETDTDRVLVYNGTGWVILGEPAQSWTPTVANLTVGNGSWSAFTRRGDGWCDYYGVFTFGTTSAVAGALTLTLPYTAATANNTDHSVQFTDTGTAEYVGIGRAATTTAVDLQAVDSSVTYARATPASSSVPFTWVSTDLLAISGRFRLANRYS